MELKDYWPEWGSTGEKPEDGESVEGGDNPKDDDWNYLWYQLRQRFGDVDDEFENVRGEIDDIDSNLSDLESDHDSLKSDFDDHTEDESAHHNRYEDSEAREAVDGADIDIKGSAHSTESDVDSLESDFDDHTEDESAHHNRYEDSEAREAVDGADIDIEGSAHSTQSDVDSLSSDFDEHDHEGDEIKPESTVTDRIESLEEEFVELKSSLGSDDKPVPDQSHFESLSTETVDSEEYLQNGEPFEAGGAIVSTEVPEVGGAGDVWARLDDSGSEIWTHELHSAAVWSVFERNGVVYSASDDNTVVAADAEDGSEIWTHELHSATVWSVFERNGVVYSASSDNTVIAAVSDPATWMSNGDEWLFQTRLVSDREGGQLG